MMKTKLICEVKVKFENEKKFLGEIQFITLEI